MVLMDNNLFFVQQIKRGIEIKGFEQGNRYLIKGKDGKCILEAIEQDNWLSRFLFSSHRPFLIEISSGNKRILTLKRPLRFLKPHLFIYDEQNNLIGCVKKVFNPVSTKYIVYSHNNIELYVLSSFLFTRRQFNIYNENKLVGQIKKKWPSSMKLLFSGGDFFGIEILEDLKLSHKKLLLGSIFLIDFIHFE